MANLVTTIGQNSTDDGSGPDTSPTPAQIPNAVDDLLLIHVSVSVNSATPPTITTPSGWTQLNTLRDNEIRAYIFYKQSTGSESFPALVSSSASEWCAVSTVITDVDYVNGPFGNSDTATANGDYTVPVQTTSAVGGGSLWLSASFLERRVFSQVNNHSLNEEYRFQVLADELTGTAEGTDNSLGLVSIFEEARSTSIGSWRMDANGSGDSCHMTHEVLTLGNVVPIQLVDFLQESLPGNSQDTGALALDAIANSGVNLDGVTMPTQDFNASSDVNTGTDEITITGHGYDESVIVRLEDNGNTAPTGLAGGEYYWIRPTGANTFELVSVNRDIDSNADWYVNGTSFRSNVNITATGTGTMTLREVRVAPASSAAMDIYKPANGNAGNPGANSGAWIGDSGWNQNYVIATRRWNAVQDFTNRVFQFTFQTNQSSRIQRTIFIAIDEDGDWIAWRLGDEDFDTMGNGTPLFQFDVASTAVQALAYSSAGTFDATRVRFFSVAYIGNNSNVARPNTAGAGSEVIAKTISFVGGTTSNPITLENITNFATTQVDTVSQPSDLQFVYLTSLQVGDGVSDVFFRDTEKSLAFPPLANGTTSSVNYLEVLGLDLRATATSEIELLNSQVGASVPFSLDISAVSGSTVSLDGSTFVFPNATFDADQPTMSRLLLVGGTGVTDNNVSIRNSTFIVNSQLGADSGMITWSGATDIQTSTFELSAGTTTGHAIIITTPGTYSFNNLTFTGFGADASVTAAVYNNSGGAVTINVSGGSTPTVRNGAGASTIVSASVPLSVTAVRADNGNPIQNARVRVVTDPGGVEVLAGVTNASGVLSGSYSGSTPQAITGVVRKSTTSPLFITGAVIGEITSSGFSTTVAMVLDE